MFDSPKSKYGNLSNAIDSNIMSKRRAFGLMII